MKFKRLFPDVPEALAALGDEALAALLTAFQAVSAKLRANANGDTEAINLVEALGIEDADISPEDVSAEVMAQWRDAAEVVADIKRIQGERAAGVEAAATEAAELDALFGNEAQEGEATDEVREGVEVPADGTEVVLEGDGEEAAAELAAESDDEPDEDEDEDAAEPESEASAEADVEEPETVTAAVAVRATPVFPAVGRRHAVPKSNPDIETNVSLVASGGLRAARITEGDVLDRDGIAAALLDVARAYPVNKVKGGTREFMRVAKGKKSFSEDRTLHQGDSMGNLEKIRALPGYFRGDHALQLLQESIQAAGGICAPPETIYTLPGYGTTARPVAAFLQTFNAARGAISVPGVTTIADYADPEADGGITVITVDEDALGGTFATKSCADMACAEWTDYEIGIVSHCRLVGNLNAITWPEGVAHENDNTMVLLARVADGRLLALMDALMLDRTGLATYGSSSSLIYNLTLARLELISSLRLDPNTRVQVLLPFWAADMFAMDLMNGAVAGDDGRFDTPASAVGGILARYGIDVGWHLDEDPAGVQEVWNIGADGSALLDWPGTQVVARMFLPGTFVRLDTGELELGLVRDSDLNHLNNHELFGELFEGVGRVGPITATRRITLTLCPDGTIAAPDTSPFTCGAS